MASDSSSSSISKSRQERIRDNQRRSRARRQEYLADLERRLKESLAMCREAELQRTAYADLQAENERLRGILHGAGINPNSAEGLGHQNVAAETGHAVEAVHRVIRPKFQQPFPDEHPDTTNPTEQASSPGAYCTSASPCSPFCASASALPVDAPGAFGSQHPVPFMAAPTTGAMNLSLTADVSPILEDWTLRPDGQESIEMPFFCNTILVPPNGRHPIDDGNTIQGSVGKMMTGQYHPQTMEMEEIEARLGPGFALPWSSEPGCRVNPQHLFGFLQNSRELYG
ncbi:hypothetical protein PV04_01474 [Phialophora macrospora]|uniref:BZIP domain-containing protein n=1 Tax=Phialophora macrospora TaxID=1851006 RepID=A0A0D2GLS0_9EURO|nr:hypothetical protein PV04_01474 [Phialophora macrospora]